MSRHAYLIMAHRNIPQLFRLLEFLDSAKTDIFLHVDRKAKDFDKTQVAQHCSHSRVTLIPRKFLSWGGDSLTQCEIALLKAALPGKYDYYHLISAQDIPLRPLHEIHRYYQEHFGEEFISINWEATNKPNSGIYNRIRRYNLFQNYVGRGSHGIKRFFWEVQLILKNIQAKIGIDRCKNLAFRLGKGSQWFSITHAFAEHLVAYYDNVLKKAFHYSFGTDELLVQTTILNSPEFFPHLSPDGNMRLIDWGRSVDGCSPHTFTSEDYDMMMGSGKLWARKVSEDRDSHIIEAIYQAVNIQEV